MTRLSDAQARILSAAAQRSTMLALPLPKNITGAAAQKVIASLLERGLLEEIDAERRIGEHIWRETEDGRSVTLAITEHGLAAIGIGPEDAPEGADTAPSAETPQDAPAEPASAPEGATEAPDGDTTPEGAEDTASAPKARKPREGTKQAQLIAMLRSPEGVTIAEIVAATGWQPHTVRGAFAGALKKKLGLEVTSEKVEGRGRVYKLPSD